MLPVCPSRIANTNGRSTRTTGTAGTDVLSISTAVTAAAFVACGGGGDQAGQEGEGEQAAQQQQGPVVPPDSQAFVRGEVQFEGAEPEAESIDMSQEQFCAAHYQDPEPRTQHVVVNDGMLQNVFVYVSSGLERSFPTPQEPATLDQQFCRYTPHVMGVQVGMRGSMPSFISSKPHIEMAP